MMGFHQAFYPGLQLGRNLRGHARMRNDVERPATCKKKKKIKGTKCLPDNAHTQYLKSTRNKHSI